MELKEILHRPDVRAALNLIAEAAAPDAAPLLANDVAEALAKVERERTAASIRTALEALDCAPEHLDRAAWLEKFAQESVEAQTVKTAACAMPSPFQAHVTQFQPVKEETQPEEPDGRGGKREGAGRKKKYPNEKKTEAKLITLYPEEWAEIDRIAEILKVKRPKVIRMALEALTRELEGKRIIEEPMTP